MMLEMQAENKKLAQQKRDREHESKVINEAKNQMEVTRLDSGDGLWASDSKFGPNGTSGGLHYDKDESAKLHWYNDTSKSRAAKMARYEKLRKLVFDACDKDNSKSITKKEFEDVLTVGNSEWQAMTK